MPAASRVLETGVKRFKDHAPLVDPKSRPMYAAMLASLTIAHIEPAKNQDVLQAQIDSSLDKYIFASSSQFMTR